MAEEIQKQEARAKKPRYFKPRRKPVAPAAASEKKEAVQTLPNQNRRRRPQEQGAERPAEQRQKEQRAKEPRGERPANPRAERTKEPRLKIISLGGVGEIGKNMTVFEFGGDMFVVDCGMTFPDGELLGVDLVIPDTTYLQKNRAKLRGIVITHAHDDHIGALPYVLRDIQTPIYCTNLTAGIIRSRLVEHKGLAPVDINVRKAGDEIKLGCFTVEFIHVNHSVPDACALAIKTPVGTVVFTGDFKIDTTPVEGEMTDLCRFGEMGKQGVRLLMMDSTNAERSGMAMSERLVCDSFTREFKDCKKRIIIACFASNVHRIQKIIEAAEAHGRKVAVSGRSMDNIIRVGSELGYIRAQKGTIIDLAQLKKLPYEQVVVITTGSQGEPMSALYRMAYSSHKQVEVGPFDKILLAASPIPGNEKAVYQMINELERKGAEVVYERLAELHVSGHACQEELRMVLSLVKPQYFMPVHGEYRHLKCNAALAQQTGVEPKSIYITEIGKVFELGKSSAAFSGKVPCGRVLIDGYGVGDVGNAILRERKLIGQDGVIIVSAVMNLRAKKLMSAVRIDTRGFIFAREAEALVRDMEILATNALEKGDRGIKSASDAVSEALSDYLYKKTKRTPAIVPIITGLE